MTKKKDYIQLCIDRLKQLDTKKRNIILDYLQHMEGSWGTLTYDSTRSEHCKFLSGFDEEFGKLFTAWIEREWNDTVANNTDEEIKRVFTTARPFEYSMVRAEIAFRDFDEWFGARNRKNMYEGVAE
jgi:hypothetical protein